MSVAVRLSGLEVSSREGRRLVGPVDLELAAGEHALLVGPSGCGKTTLLRAIAGLATPSAGSVELFGERASEAGRLLIGPARRGIGMMFQGGALWPHMSARRTLEFTMKSAGKRPSRERVAELLGLVQLEGFESRLPASLSGGEAQRLSLARAMACEPRILLLDEPLGPLDQGLRRDLLARIGELHRAQGWTLVHVTHDPEEAAEQADRTVTLSAEGRLEEVSA